VSEATAYAREPAADDFGGYGVLLPWDDFVLWLRGRKTEHQVSQETVTLGPPWKPGQHWAHIGKTREGKTNFVVAKAQACRSYVMALDPKGNDPTLVKSGWTRVDGVPPHKRFPKEIQKALDEERPVSIIVGSGTRTRADDEANRVLMGQAVEYARESGGWTVIVDEHQVASDPRMYRIGPEIARMAVSAASDKTSVEVCMQYVSWSEKAPLRQATFVSFWHSRSKDLFQKLALEVGRDWRELAQIADELPKYYVATLSDDLRAPVIVTRPPKI
jgi:hypothetical protein